MSRVAVFLLAATLAVIGLTGAAAAETYFGFTIGVTNAPPPPRVVYVREPRVVLVPRSTVYVVEDDYGDDDMFRCGGSWYVYSRGYWYRGPSYRGPFRVIDARRVPRAIYGVPSTRWRHHPHGGPPGQMKKYRRVDDDDRDDRGDRDDRERGHGHGKH